MLKKLMIGIVAIVLLSGAVFLNAQEVLGIPKAQQQQQKKVQQKRRQKAPQRTDKKKGQQIKQETEVQKPRSKRPAEQQLNRIQMFQRWFSGMKNAYREKDMEKMGQLLRTMEQRQQQMRKQRELNMWHDKQHRQKAMNRRRTGVRRQRWAKSNYHQRQRSGSYPKSRVYDRNFIESDRNRRPRSRQGRKRHRPEWRRYYRL
jgi:hypothetical protein